MPRPIKKLILRKPTDITGTLRATCAAQSAHLMTTMHFYWCMTCRQKQDTNITNNQYPPFSRCNFFLFKMHCILTSCGTALQLIFTNLIKSTLCLLTVIFDIYHSYTFQSDWIISRLYWFTSPNSIVWDDEKILCVCVCLYVCVCVWMCVCVCVCLCVCHVYNSVDQFSATLWLFMK
jgi:hypothetical protein